MTILAWFLIGFLMLRLAVVITNLVTRPWLKKDRNKLFSEGTPAAQALVSVLIPARNEASGIGSLLEDLIRHDYRNLEILVYDDLSTDGTAQKVREYERRDSRIRLIPGDKLPEGWLGKNHACHRLAGEARGQYFLFLDADVTIESGLIISALEHLRKHHLALLSIFPQQQLETRGELAVVPLMNWILVSMLPLILTRRSSRPSLSAANGQFMLFESGAYLQNQFHRQVRNQKVEDILIFRLMKRKRLRVQTLLSNGQVKCRMYRGFREAIQGFSKNVFEFFGGSVPLAFVFMLITLLGFVPVWIALGPQVALGYLVVGLTIRMLAALVSRQSLAGNFFFAPVQQISLILVILNGLNDRIKKQTTWKGRKVDQV